MGLKTLQAQENLNREQTTVQYTRRQRISMNTAEKDSPRLQGRILNQKQTDLKHCHVPATGLSRTFWNLLCTVHLHRKQYDSRNGAGMLPRSLHQNIYWRQCQPKSNQRRATSIWWSTRHLMTLWFKWHVIREAEDTSTLGQLGLSWCRNHRSEGITAQGYAKGSTSKKLQFDLKWTDMINSGGTGLLFYR